MKVVDHLVIGSGPSGAITAKLLFESGFEVEMIESGENFSQVKMNPFSNDEMLSQYWAKGMTVMLGWPKINYVAGRCLGGGSEVNSGFYHRTPKTILDFWDKKFQLETSSLDEHFDSIERSLNVGLMPKEKIPQASRNFFMGPNLWDGIVKKYPECSNIQSLVQKNSPCPEPFSTKIFNQKLKFIQEQR